MDTNFLNQTVKFIKQSDLILYPTVYRPYEYIKNDDGQLILSGNLYAEDYINRPRLSNNLILQIIVIFSALDAKIDKDYPALQGQTFRNKYRNLPNSSDDEIILKECFRIFKLLRNAATHSMNSISIIDEDIIADYYFNDTHYNLKITKVGISWLFTYIIELFDSRTSPTLNHSIALKRELFELLKNEISAFSDDFGNGLNPISSDLKLRRIVRYLIKGSPFEINSDKLKIKKPYKFIETYEKDYGADYLIQVSDNETYLIPGEVLSNDYDIKLADAQNWKLAHS